MKLGNKINKMKLLTNYFLLFLIFSVAFLFLEIQEQKREIENVNYELLVTQMDIVELVQAFNKHYNFDSIKNDTRHDYYVHAWEMANKHDVPYNVLVNLLFHESGFNPNAYNENLNGSYDYGIAQVNSNYKEFFEEKYKIEIDGSYEAIEFASIHLADLYDTFNDYYLSVMAYNCGERAVLNNKIPNMTRNYVKVIMGY